MFVKVCIWRISFTFSFCLPLSFALLSVFAEGKFSFSSSLIICFFFFLSLFRVSFFTPICSLLPLSLVTTGGGWDRGHCVTMCPRCILLLLYQCLIFFTLVHKSQTWKALDLSQKKNRKCCVCRLSFLRRLVYIQIQWFYVYVTVTSTTLTDVHYG